MINIFQVTFTCSLQYIQKNSSLLFFPKLRKTGREDFLFICYCLLISPRT